MRIAMAKARPVTLAGTRQLEVHGALGGLFPAGGLQRGVVVEVGGGAALSLSLVLAAGVMGAGSSSWAAAVGFPSLGLVAAAQMGVPLERLALVPAPGRRWAEVVAALLDGVDLILVSAPAGLRASDARRLAARARERGAVLVPVRRGAAFGCWPESPDLRLETVSQEWIGLGAGHGYLRRRRIEVVLSGRRAFGGSWRSIGLWLPGPGGMPVAAEPSAPASGPIAPAPPEALSAVV